MEIASLLLDRGANIIANDNEALRFAGIFYTQRVNFSPFAVASKGYINVVRLLLESGKADIHAQDDYAIRYACANGHQEIVELLMLNGANVHALDEFALSVSWSAKRNQSESNKLGQRFKWTFQYCVPSLTHRWR
jgi:hypothetical protein